LEFLDFPTIVRQKNPDVKAILSIGGNDSDPSIFASLTSSGTHRREFISSSISVARESNYDGLSLNWQYPSTIHEMEYLGVLLIEWSDAVTEEAEQTQRAPLLLTAAVFYSPNYLSLDYPFLALNDSLDWIDVLAYDIYTPLSSPNFIEPPAPLYRSETNNLSVDSGILDWIDAGVSANKLVLGLPFYGRSWLIDNGTANGTAPGFDPIAYRIIETLPSPPWVKEADISAISQSSENGTTWIGYDGTYSIPIKVYYAYNKGLLGYFVWHVADDTLNWTLSETG